MKKSRTTSTSQKESEKVLSKKDVCFHCGSCLSESPHNCKPQRSIQRQQDSPPCQMLPDSPKSGECNELKEKPNQNISKECNYSAASSNLPEGSTDAPDPSPHLNPLHGTPGISRPHKHAIPAASLDTKCRSAITHKRPKKLRNASNARNLLSKGNSRRRKGTSKKGTLKWPVHNFYRVQICPGASTFPFFKYDGKNSKPMKFTSSVSRKMKQQVLKDCKSPINVSSIPSHEAIKECHKKSSSVSNDIVTPEGPTKSVDLANQEVVSKPPLDFAKICLASLAEYDLPAIDDKNVSNESVTQEALPVVAVPGASVADNNKNSVQNLVQLDQDSLKESVAMVPPNNPSCSTVQEPVNMPVPQEALPVPAVPGASVEDNNETVLKLTPCFVDLSKNNFMLQKPYKELPKDNIPQYIVCVSQPIATSSVSVEQKSPLVVKGPSLNELKKNSKQLTEPENRPAKKEKQFIVSFDRGYVLHLIKKGYEGATKNNKECDWAKVYNKYLYSPNAAMSYDAFYALVQKTIHDHEVCAKLKYLRHRMTKVINEKHTVLKTKKKVYYDGNYYILVDEIDYDQYVICVQNMKRCNVKLVPCTLPAVTPALNHSNKIDQTRVYYKKNRYVLVDTSCLDEAKLAVKNAEKIKISVCAMDITI